MKIAFICPHSLDQFGGVQKHILSLKKEFEKRNHKIKIISPRERFPQEKQKDEILLGGALYIPGNASWTTLSLALNPVSILKTLKKEKFDILHFQNFGFFLPYQILEIADKISKNSLKILTFHALLDGSWLFREFPGLLNFFSSYILPNFDGMIGVSKPVLSQLQFQGPKKVIPNGVDLDFFKPKGQKIKKFASKNFLNLLFVGRIEKRKGLIYLIKAYEILKKKYQKIRLIVVGSGTDEDKIKTYVFSKKIKDIFFEGKVKEEDLPKYYRTADICVFPSFAGEAFGMVLLEAMASGKPIVAFANQGYKEVIKGEGAHFLARPKNIIDLKNKIEILIKNQALREKMGKWGRKEAKKYSWKKIAKETLDFYQDVKYKK